MSTSNNQSNPQTSRRRFLQQVTATGIAAPFFVRNLISAPPSATVRLAAFGAGGMGFYTLDGIARHPKVKLACVAEVDSAKLNLMQPKYPDARVYQDWREMLKKEHKNVDMVCVGTPDHVHALMAMASMRHELPVYCQKPLTHDIFEARRLTEFARKKKLVTQMGIQIHSRAEYKTAVLLVQTGAIGKIKEVYTWSGKKWGDMEPLPAQSDPVPSTLNWDLWIGPCAPRPYIKGYYHPGNWRKRIDFGTATFGDMGCHIYDPVYEALKLTAPLRVRSEGPAPGKDNWAINAIVHYEFPGTEYSEDKTVKVTWYDGDERPPREIQALIETTKLPDQGSILIGTKGVMLIPHVGMPKLYPEAQFKDFKMPQVESVNHYFEFADAVMGNGKTTTSFDYSGPLTETVLLGSVAARFPKTTLEWNATKLKFTNSREATEFVRRKYRSGWKVKGL